MDGPPPGQVGICPNRCADPRLWLKCSTASVGDSACGHVHLYALIHEALTSHRAVIVVQVGADGSSREGRR
jgi:hypothetical protein